MICLRRGSWIRFWRWVSSHFKNVKKIWHAVYALRSYFVKSTWRIVRIGLNFSLTFTLPTHTATHGGALPGLVAHWWCHRVHITHSFTHWLNPDWNFPSSLLFKKKKKKGQNGLNEIRKLDEMVTMAALRLSNISRLLLCFKSWYTLKKKSMTTNNKLFFNNCVSLAINYTVCFHCTWYEYVLLNLMFPFELLRPWCYMLRLCGHF